MLIHLLVCINSYRYTRRPIFFFFILVLRFYICIKKCKGMVLQLIFQRGHGRKRNFLLDLPYFSIIKTPRIKMAPGEPMLFEEEEIPKLNTQPAAASALPEPDPACLTFDFLILVGKFFYSLQIMIAMMI